ncbi:hypothetical protein BC832DRAFT_304638 [Gaertneriomyces semiglobifer]|nr:hypothetical protein BC832DRAFT_304638 [Gaertneriomyces semiglobifer]
MCSEKAHHPWMGMNIQFFLLSLPTSQNPLVIICAFFGIKLPPFKRFPETDMMCFLGHPHVAVTSILTLLSSLSQELTASTTTFPLDATPQFFHSLSRIRALLQHIEILTRYDGNRDAIRRHSGVESIVQVISLGSTMISRGPLDSNIQDDTSQIVFYSLGVLQRSLDSSLSWNAFVRSNIPPSPTLTDAPPWTTALHLTLLRALAVIYKQPGKSRTNQTLRIQALNTLGALLSQWTPTLGNALNLCGVLDVVASIIGNPATERTDEEEFACQVLAWDVIRLGQHHSLSKPSSIADNVAGLWKWSYDCTFPNSSLLSALHSPERRVLDVSPVDWSECSIEPDVLSQAIFTAAAGISKILPHRVISHVLGSRRPKEATLSKGIEDFILYLARILRMSGRVRDGVIIALTHLLAKAGEDIEKRRSYVFNSLGTHNLWPMLIADLSPVAVSFCTYAGVLGCADVVPQLLSSVESHQDAQLVCEIIGPLVQFRPDLGKLLADSGGMEKLMSLLQSVETSEVDMERFVALFEILLQNPDIKAWSLPRSEIFVSLLERGVGKDAEFGASFLVECISALAAQSQQEEDSNGDSKAGNNHTRIITLGGILHQTFASMENVDPRTAPVIFRGLQVVLEDERKRERVVDSGGPGCFVGILGSKLAQKSDDVVVGALRCLGACGKVGTWVWDDVLSQIGQPSSAVLQALEAVLLSSSTTAPNMNEETLRSILKAYNQWSRTCKAWLRRFLIQHVQACRLNMYRAGVLEWSIGCINDMRFTDDTVETGDVEEISELCEIVKWVGSWGVRVRDVKGLLRATRPRNTKETSSEADPELGDLRPFLSSLPESWVLPSWWDLLFNTIVDIAVDGERGDLELFYKETVGITVDKWPGGSGWGILCWFWSEEGSLDGLPVTRFVMRKEDSEHEIALSSEEVVTGEQPMHRLRLKAPGVDVTSETSLTTGWHLVVLSYIPSKLPWTSQGELKFWLDGNPLTRTRCDGLESGRWSNIVGKDVSVVHMVDDVVRGREVRAAFKNGVKGLVEGRSTVAGRFGGIARKTFTSALHAVGGVGVLLGILSVLDLPTAGATVSEDDGRLCLRVKRWFQLLKACLGDAVHRGSLLGIRGAIAMLLRRWHGRGLNTETFLKVLDIARIECMADFDELAFDFHIWGVTKTEMCLEWLRSVHQNVRTEAEVVVHTTNVKKNYNRKWNATYWIGVLADNCFPTTDTKDMQLLRKFVLGVAKEILSQRWDEADMRSIIELLWRWTGTNLLLEEVISVLLEVFVHCPDARALEGFFAVGGAELVFWMLSHNDAGEAVRVLCLQLIFLGLNNPRIHEKWKKRLRLEDVGWLCGDNKEGSIALLMPMLQKVALSRRVYLGVLQLALDEVILDWETREALCSVVELRNGKVQSVDYLQVIWRLCASRNVEAKVKIDILRDLIVIVCRKGNGDVVRSTEWIEGVVGMLTPRRKGLKDRGAEAESTKELSDTEPVWPLMDEEVVLASPMPNANAEGHTGLTVDQTPQPAIGSSGEDERVTALVYEALTALTLETFDKNRKAWHSAEEVCAWIWITDGDFTSVKTYLIRVLKKLNEGIGVGGWKCVGHNRLENIVHLLLLSEEVMFGWRDLREGVLKEVRGDQEKSRLAFLPDILTAGTPTMRSPTTVRMSFPIGECPDLVEECLDILSGMIDFGINSVDLSDKSHARPGGLVRLAVRILLSALAVPDEAAWHLAFRHLIPLMDKHAAIFTERKEQAYYILGHLYDGFAAACRTKGDDNGASHVDYHILLPLYTLLVSRWKHLILGLSSVDDASKPLLDEQLIDKAIADPEVFVHLVQSPIWESLYNTYFFPAMRSVEESEFAMVPTVVRRFARAGKAMRMRVLKERAFVELLGGAMTSSLEKIAMGKREDESAKVPEREREIESDRRVVWKTWAECWKSITRERGIWGTAGTMKWKLDRTENAWRMRNRFVENWEFDDHSDASAKRDKTMKPEEDLGGALTRSASVRERLATSVGDGVLRQLSALSLNYNDSEEGDEWNMVGEEDAFSPTPAGPLLDVSDKGMAYSGECELILLNTAVKGRVEVSKTRITFKPDVKATTAGVSEAEREAIFVLLADADVLFKDRSWWVDDIRDCLLRRYMLRKASLELFFTDRTNWMFHFPGTGKVALKERAKFLKALRALKPKIFAGADPRRTPADIAKRSGVTELWCKGALSNFEYLMWLNTVSGENTQLNVSFLASSDDLTFVP